MTVVEVRKTFKVAPPGMANPHPAWSQVPPAIVAEPVNATGPVAGPGLEGGDEGGLVDQAVLQRQQAEEEIALGGGHGWTPRPRRDTGEFRS